MNVIEAIRDALTVAMSHDDRVMVLGMDVGRLGGVFRATEGLLDTFGPERVVDTPLSESAIVGASLGLAVAGLRPVAEIQFLGFLHHAFHQLGPQLGRLRFRSRGRFSAPVVIRAPYGGGTRMPEFHADSIEAQLANCPGLKIVLPSTPSDAKGLLLSAIEDPDPVIFMEPQALYRAGRAEVPAGEYKVPLGKASLVRTGGDLTLVAWGQAMRTAMAAADALAAQGIDAAVLDLRTLVPLDVETLVDAVADTGVCVVIQDGPRTAGFAAEVVATVQERAFRSLDAPVQRVCGLDTPYPPGALEDWYLPSVARVLAAVQECR
ncbi:alpha-ketoacid dehydrogenase subunit beta [Pseudonocardia sp.]|jgi:pyruvate dehydrogenase E1 component beta subunit|uniref:alpha-ketoacid dehydrogenase subunit beta n=1 Tax=Pseudonocardia sp. TaxID=60912 RepID=UPI0031FBD622